MFYVYKPWSNYNIQAKCPLEWSHIVNSSVFNHICSTKIENHGVIFLDKDYNLIEICIDSIGTYNQCFPKIHEIVQRAVELKAYYIVDFHNHPNEVVKPSNEDRRFFKLLQMKCSEFSPESECMTANDFIRNDIDPNKMDVNNKMNTLKCLDSIILTYDNIVFAPLEAYSIALNGHFSTEEYDNKLLKLLKKREYKFNCIKAVNRQLETVGRENKHRIFKPKQKYFPSIADRTMHDIFKDEMVRGRNSYNLTFK